MFFGGAAFQTTRIPAQEWAISLALGFGTILVGFLIRCIPNSSLERVFTKLRIISSDEVLPTAQPEAVQWNEAIAKVRDNLSLKGKRSRVPKEDRVIYYSSQGIFNSTGPFRPSLTTMALPS